LAFEVQQNENARKADRKDWFGADPKKAVGVCYGRGWICLHSASVNWTLNKSYGTLVSFV
jgi:hypothetical protein